MFRAGLCFFTAWSALALGLTALQAQQFEVEGDVTYWNFLISRGHSSREPDVHFRLSVDGRKWFIHTTTESKVPDYVEAAYDENWLYSVTCMKTAVGRWRAEHGSSGTGTNIATAWIYNGEILHDSFSPTIGPVWLAFASGSYFDRLTNGMAEPVVADPPDDRYSARDPFRQKVELKRHRSFPNLPEEVIYFDDGFLHFDGTLQPITPLQPRRPPYDAGFTNAIYRVFAWTNVGDLVLPAMSRLDAFAPKDTAYARKHPGKTNTALILKSRYQIHLTSARQNPSLRVSRPKLPGVTAISDTRFYDWVPFIQSYFASKDWVSAETVTNSPEFRRLANVTKAPDPPPRNR